jgi:1,4-alpha-glucan branching enzyme
VWSPRRGYPGGRWYRDFHTFDHEWGFRPARVTGLTVAPADKAPYDAGAALRAAERDAVDFVDVVRARLESLARARGRPGIVVAAYDTELFGHWWFEGPHWLERVLRLLPEAGVRVTTLRGAIEGGAVAGRADPGAGSWGSGKDWRVWDGERVADLVEQSRALQAEVLAAVDAMPLGARSAVHDQVVRELLLAMSSDWAFMVSKDSAAGYARSRADGHVVAARGLLAALDSEAVVDSGPRPPHGVKTSRFIERFDTVRGSGGAGPWGTAAGLSEHAGPFGHLDARLFHHDLTVSERPEK